MHSDVGALLPTHADRRQATADAPHYVDLLGTSGGASSNCRVNQPRAEAHHGAPSR